VISHKYRCIFIHIQRCAGTSVEYWLVGADWWTIDPATKHLTASQAKEIYAAHWADYFKFAIVREPLARTLSCLKYARHFGLGFSRAGGFDFSGYHRRYGADVVLEHDQRFYDRRALLKPRHRSGQIYGNILDEPLDFIGRFETLDRDMEEVRRIVGKREPLAVHAERFAEKPLREEEIAPGDAASALRLYRRDCERFGWASPAPRGDAGARGAMAASPSELRNARATDAAFGTNTRHISFASCRAADGMRPRATV
jgi:hypothetical protein